MSSTQKDTTFTKIFVGGLPYHTTDESLRDFFIQFGEIEEAVVITERSTSKSRGYGFVTMADRLGAERACKDPNPIIDGRKANVNLAYLGAKPRVVAGSPLALAAAAAKLNYPALHSQIVAGLPQYFYAASSPYVTTPGILSVAPHSPLSPTATATSPLLEYSGVAAAANASSLNTTAATASQLPAGYEAAAAAYQYAYAAPYTYATVPQQLTAAAALPTAYQAQAAVNLAAAHSQAAAAASDRIQ